MHSKWQIWDALRNLDTNYLSVFQGTLILLTPDPISLKIIKDHLFKTKKDRNILHKSASEIDKNWLVDEFEALSFFQNYDCFFIHQAHDLNLEIFEKISDLQLNERFIILSFESQGSFWKKVSGMKSFSILEIESPKFWEGQKLLDFCLNYFKLGLSYQAKAWILDSLENNLLSFYQACSTLKINYPNIQQIELESVKQHLFADKVDLFYLASLLSKKKERDFFKTLNHGEQDFEKMRDIFRFLQSHFIKLADVSFLKNKSRLTSYDKELQTSASLWSEREIFAVIKTLNDLEILAKKRSSELWWKLQKELLNIEVKIIPPS